MGSCPHHPLLENADEDVHEMMEDLNIDDEYCGEFYCTAEFDDHRRSLETLAADAGLNGRIALIECNEWNHGGGLGISNYWYHGMITPTLE